MKIIELTQGKFAKVDDEDYEYLNQWKWCANESAPGMHYAVRNACITIDYKKGYKGYKMHRVIMQITDPKTFVDHINGDTLNNQRYNLRVCSCSQNSANRKSVKNKTLVYIGVCKVKHKGLLYWRGSVKSKGKNYMKNCKTEIEAAIWYNKKATELHGEFARLNTIEYKSTEINYITIDELLWMEKEFLSNKSKQNGDKSERLYTN